MELNTVDPFTDSAWHGARSAISDPILTNPFMILVGSIVVIDNGSVPVCFDL